MPVCVEGDGYAVEPYQAPHQQEVVVGVLLLAEQRVGHDAGGVVDGQQHRKEGPSSPSHRLWLPSTCISMPSRGIRCRRTRCRGGRRPAAARALQAGSRQHTPQRGPTDVYPLALSEQLAQVSVVGVRVAGLSKAQHLGLCRL